MGSAARGFSVYYLSFLGSGSSLLKVMDYCSGSLLDYSLLSLMGLIL